MNAGLEIVIRNPELTATKRDLVDTFIQGDDRLRQGLGVQASLPFLGTSGEFTPRGRGFENECQSPACHRDDIKLFHKPLSMCSGIARRQYTSEEPAGQIRYSVWRK